MEPQASPIAAAAPAHPLSPMLSPRSIALVGASRKRNTVGNDMIRNILASEFAGTVYAVNKSYQSLYGIACFPSMSCLPEAVDLAVLAVPNRVLEQVMAEAIAAGARAVAIFGSAEMEDEGDDRLRDRIARMAEEAGVPVCGANCMGFINTEGPLRVFSSFHPEPLPTGGGLTYIAQSGSLLTALMFNDERLRFNLAVSTGQELVTTAADYLDYAIEQPSTRAVAMVLEAIRDTDKFIAALEKAHAREIPVIVLKLGRTEAGARMALSHTGAIAGNNEVYTSFFRRFGVLQVRDLTELAATAILMSSSRRAASGGLAAILDSGGERELVVDVADDVQVRFAEIGPETQEVLRANLDANLEAINPVDAWGTGKDFEMVFENCLTALMKDEDTGIGMFVADLSEDLDLHEGYVDVCEAVARSTPKPVIMMTNYSAWNHRKYAVRLARAGIPVLDGTEASLRAVKHALDYRDFLALEEVVEKQDEPNPKAAYWRALLADRTEPLTEDEGYALLADYGISIPRHAIVESRDEAIAAAQRIGFPLVMKTAVPGIIHKSDVGGVVLNIGDVGQAVSAYEQLASRLGARVLVSQQSNGTVEMAFGLVRDEKLGSFVMIAMGGIWVELLKDSQIARLPIDENIARRRISKLKMARILDGIRGEEPCDKQALIDTYVKISRMAADLGDLIAEMDINPVLVSPAGVVAVDSLIVPISTNREAAHAV